MAHARRTATIAAAPVAAEPARAGAATSEPGVLLSRTLSRRRGAFVALALLADCAMILIAYCFSDAAYMTLKLGWSAIWLLNPQLGVFAAITFGASNILRHGYAMSEYINMSGQPQRVFSQWNFAFFGATTLAFLSHVIEDSSRGVFLIFYPSALFALFAGRAVLVLMLRQRARRGALTVSRALVVGFSADIAGVLQRLDPRRDGVRIAGIRVLSHDPQERARGVAEAVQFARELLPDDIVIAAPWSRADVIDECVTAFMRVPAALHLNFAADCVMARFVAAPERNRLTLHALQLDAHAISAFGGAMKRALDIVAATIGLAALSPLFALVALAIKLDSPGPVFFRQQRYGFNRAPFRIWKFRTMSTVEDGAEVRQATRGDPRISRLGAWLRRSNIDELPQLINVLMGEMSLVGPRPHALVHDHAFEPDVPLYARRHNAKPGITGWAQVNGLRGETDTQDKITRRVAHDLYYLDNWSLAFDLWIIALTLFSRKAYANAG